MAWKTNYWVTHTHISAKHITQIGIDHRKVMFSHPKKCDAYLLRKCDLGLGFSCTFSDSVYGSIGVHIVGSQYYGIPSCKLT